MTLNERIHNIRLTLQKPFHFFTLLPGKSVKTSPVVLVLEDEAGINRFSFQGNSIVEAIENAEKYIEGEKKMGSLRDRSEDEKKEEIIETTEDLQKTVDQDNEEETQQEKNEKVEKVAETQTEKE